MATRQGKGEEYELGQEVTSSAACKSRTGTAVLSVRLSAQEVAAIEAVSRATGKSVSQVVRDAVTTYVHFHRAGQYTVTLSSVAGTLSTGCIDQVGKGTPGYKNFLVAQESHGHFVVKELAPSDF